MAIKKDGERSRNYVLDKITLNMWTILVKVCPIIKKEVIQMLIII